MAAADDLRRRLERGTKWPIDWEREVRNRILLWAAFRESDDVALKRVAEWPNDRQYVIDNLPEKIAQAFGAMLFGQDAEITAAKPADQERLDDLVDANELTSALQQAEELCASEGEVWWRISVDPEIDHPLVTWHSRADVVPLLNGRNVIAAAFVSRLPDPDGDPKSKDVWRHVELQSRGRVENLLYLGTKDGLGQSVSLARHPDTRDLRDGWDHQIPALLAGRITNKIGRNPYCGISDYLGVWTQFLVLNEATTIGRENMRLTAKKRAVVPPGSVAPPPTGGSNLVDRGDGSMVPADRPQGRFDAGEDLFVVDPLDVEEGRDSSGPFRVLEYSFDADALVAYMRHVVETICIRCDIVPQFIGQGDFGQGESGTALRVRLLPTINAAQGKARPWDDQLPRILQLLQLVEEKSRAEGGIGREWTDAAEAPAVKRSEPLPEDPAEETTRHVALRGAELISTRQSLRERHPDWSDEQVDEEITRIREDAQSLTAAPPPPPGAGG